MSPLQSFKSIWLNKIAGILFLIFLSHTSVFSQYADTAVYYVKATISGNVNKTNGSNTYLSNNNVKMSIMKKRSILNAFGSWVYGKQNVGLTNNDYNVSADFNVYDNPQTIFAWGFSSYDKSYSLKIINRYQGGVGLGYEIFKSTAVKLNISDGILYENSNLDQTADPSVMDIETFRNSLRIKYTVTIEKVIVFSGSNYWQPSVENFDDYIIKANNTLNINIKKWLSLNVTTTYNKLNITARENFLLTYGLTFERTF